MTKREVRGIIFELFIALSIAVLATPSWKGASHGERLIAVALIVAGLLSGRLRSAWRI
jgi:hypothetical protein